MKVSRLLASWALFCTLSICAMAASKPSSTTNSWALQATLSAAIDDPLQLGFSVGISGDTIVTTGGSTIYVYERATPIWPNMSRPTAKLTTTDGTPMYAVAISGNTIVAGSTSVKNETGAVYVFVKPATGWKNMTETAKLTASDAGQGDFFGTSVAIAGDTIVAGALQNNSVGASFPQANGPGAAYVFVRPTSGWTNGTETAKLTASDGVSDDDFGYNVAMQGETIAISAPNATIGSTTLEGAVYVFQKNGTQWKNSTETAKLTASDGHEVSVVGIGLSMYGNTVAAAAFYKVYLFNRPAKGWASESQTAELTSTAYPAFGLNSVAVSNQYVLVGAPYENRPFADLYVKPSSTWTNSHPTSRLLAPKNNGNGSDGWSVAISGTTLVVGSPLNGGTGGNMVYVYGQK